MVVGGRCHGAWQSKKRASWQQWHPYIDRRLYMVMYVTRIKPAKIGTEGGCHHHHPWDMEQQQLPSSEINKSCLAQNSIAHSAQIPSFESTSSTFKDRECGGLAIGILPRKKLMWGKFFFTSSCCSSIIII